MDRVDQADGCFTLGVEEEYQIVDPATRSLRPRGDRVLDRAQRALGGDVQAEFKLSQIETATPVCRTLAEVRAELRRLRRRLLEAAAREESRILAAGTHPFSHAEDQPLTPKRRYRALAADYQKLARELVIFGCHVHVGIADRDLAVEVLNRSRSWLTPLLALSANSPFWGGEDTGYASYRTELWTRWPTAGPPQLFASRQEHDELVQALIATGVIKEATQVYWDIRLPAGKPTVEFRVADVCLTIDEAVMIAGLTRALAATCAESARRNTPFPPVRGELLRAAHWRAARQGLEGELIDVQAARAVPARHLIESLLGFTRPALEAAGDWDEVSALVEQTLARGNGASRQRAVYSRTGSLEDVVDFLAVETAKDILGG